MTPERPADSRPPILAVDRLTTVFDTPRGPLPAVEDVSFDVRAGETLALVGESGCGKSVTALSIMRLVRPPGRIAGGRVLFKGRDLLALTDREMQSLRGAQIALVFQEPSAALNPVFRIGDQIAEALVVHNRVPKRDAKARAVELLRSVRIPSPETRIADYPHQLSGGMRQRVMIALAVACQPALLIADEPTTALDATIQAEVLDLLREMKSAFHLALLLITHDLGIVAGAADRVAVMYAGRIVETGPVRTIFSSPAHPYTRGLLASIPGGEPGGRLRAIEGSVPLPGDLPAGCAFTPRCPDRFDRCPTAPPPDFAAEADHTAKCYLYEHHRLSGADDGDKSAGGADHYVRPTHVPR